MKRLKHVVVIVLLIICSVCDAQVRVTYYNLKGITANGTKTRNGICAVSRDLEKKGYKLGDSISLEGYGNYLIADRTSKRIKNTVDIWTSKTKKLKNGRNIRISRIVKHYPYIERRIYEPSKIISEGGYRFFQREKDTLDSILFQFRYKQSGTNK